MPITESHPTNPITSYGIVKLAVEKYLGLFDQLHGLDYTALRISNPYGPYQNPGGRQGAVPVFLHRLHTGHPVTIRGDGSVMRDYLYVSDLVEALKLAAEVQTRQKVFDIGSGRGTTLNELVAIIAEVTGERPEVEYVQGTRRPGQRARRGQGARGVGLEPHDLSGRGHGANLALDPDADGGGCRTRGQE